MEYKLHSLLVDFRKVDTYDKKHVGELKEIIKLDKVV